MTQEELIKGCIKHNRNAQEALYHLYKKTLFVLCLKYCPNETEAEDNLHDAFIEIYSNIKNYKAHGTFEGWIKRITINKAINRYKQSYFLVPIRDDYTQDTKVEDYEIDFSLDYILSLIQELPQQYRFVFSLFELDGYTHKEISELLSITESTSKSNLHRAKLILKEKIKSKKSFHNYQSSNGK